MYIFVHFDACWSQSCYYSRFLFFVSFHSHAPAQPALVWDHSSNRESFTNLILAGSYNHDPLIILRSRIRLLRLINNSLVTTIFSTGFLDASSMADFNIYNGLSIAPKADDDLDPQLRTWICSLHLVQPLHGLVVTANAFAK